MRYSCGESYIRDQERSMENRWAKHKKPTKKQNQQDICQTTPVTHLSGRYLCRLPKVKGHERI